MTQKKGQHMASPKNSQTHYNTIVGSVLDRLDKVRQTGNGKYTACCPAHDDRSPSLSIKEADNGKVLVYCFAGCRYDDVLAAIGLRPTDLFPDSPRPLYNRSERKRQQYEDALLFEQHIVAQIEHMIERGQDISDADRERGSLAIDRILKIDSALKNWRAC